MALSYYDKLVLFLAEHPSDLAGSLDELKKLLIDKFNISSDRLSPETVEQMRQRALVQVFFKKDGVSILNTPQTEQKETIAAILDIKNIKSVINDRTVRDIFRSVLYKKYMEWINSVNENVLKEIINFDNTEENPEKNFKQLLEGFGIKLSDDIEIGPETRTECINAAKKVYFDKFYFNKFDPESYLLSDDERLFNHTDKNLGLKTLTPEDHAYLRNKLHDELDDRKKKDPGDQEKQSHMQLRMILRYKEKLDEALDKAGKELRDLKALQESRGTRGHPDLSKYQEAQERWNVLNTVRNLAHPTFQKAEELLHKQPPPGDALTTSFSSEESKADQLSSPLLKHAKDIRRCYDQIRQYQQVIDAPDKYLPSKIKVDEESPLKFLGREANVLTEKTHPFGFTSSIVRREHSLAPADFTEVARVQQEGSMIGVKLDPGDTYVLKDTTNKMQVTQDHKGLITCSSTTTGGGLSSFEKETLALTGAYEMLKQYKDNGKPICLYAKTTEDAHRYYAALLKLSRVENTDGKSVMRSLLPQDIKVVLPPTQQEIFNKDIEALARYKFLNPSNDQIVAYVNQHLPLTTRGQINDAVALTQTPNENPEIVKYLSARDKIQALTKSNKPVEGEAININNNDGDNTLKNKPRG